MRRMMIAAGLAALTIGAAASAQAPINVRQLNQERRIDAGTRSGKLTRGEAARLRAEQHSIRRMEQRMKARHGGHLTHADNRLIHERQEQANAHILHQKYNARRGKDHLKL